MHLLLGEDMISTGMKVSEAMVWTTIAVRSNEL